MKLPAWLAVVAIVVGLGSTTTAVVLHAQSQHDVCQVTNVQGDRTRKFLTDLLKDPTVPAATRSAVAKLALEDFPRSHC